ncbi:GntR family transcriptional regulator [Micropruina sp.]|uniref:GntR family transcriptional regulator n=1 Tax=Micropruina sp. TaxID=2737536 RepID=UPI0039E5A54E
MSPRVRSTAALVAQLRPSGTSQEEVLTELRRVLVSGRVKPGTLLPLDSLARAFGVSRTPVREALKTLLGEGLISHNHRGGYIVHALSRDEFVELYTIRRALEAAALGASALLADQAHQAAVSESLAQQRIALKLGDVAGWDLEGRAFHEALVAACDMPRLCRLIRDAANATGTTRPMLRLPLARIEHLHGDHEAMASAFAAGDVESLQRTAGEHLHRVCTWLLEAFDGVAC